MNNISFLSMAVLITAAFFGGCLIAAPNKQTSGLPYAMCIVLIAIGVALFIAGVHT